MLGQKSSTAAAVVVVVAAIGVDVLLSACGGSAPTRPTPIPIVLTVVISVSYTHLTLPTNREV